MTVSSHSHTRGAGTGAGAGTRAARDEAAVLSVAGHLTDRDRELVRLVARHRVLTTDQLAALAFGNSTTARHRLAVLVRLGLLRRFRPHRATGSAPWHHVLGPIGAALLGQENHDEKRWLPQVRADRQLALERSQRLGHMTGASWFFVALARHAREHGGGKLLQWDSEGQASDYLYAHSRELGPRPDGLGVWAQDGRDITFLLEYDTGTEHLPQLTAKLCGYAESVRTTLALTMPLLFCFLTPAASRPPARPSPPPVHPWTSISRPPPSTRAPPARHARRRGCPCTAATRQCGSSTWATCSPTPGAPNANTTS